MLAASGELDGLGQFDPIAVPPVVMRCFRSSGDKEAHLFTVLVMPARAGIRCDR